ncbi:regulator [Serratia fonticola]|nr:regulator [Serratia fonticola]
MRKKELEGFVEVRHAVDAVPYPKFAEMIGKKEDAVKSMIDAGKLPIIPWTNPETKSPNPRSENWVYIPEFNRAMRDAFYNRPKEQRDAWLLWIGL